jgi:alpha-glucosidase (family GH31 glycosyl hydrolase)
MVKNQPMVLKLVLALVLVTLLVAEFVIPPTNYKSAPYDSWAHSHFIWLHNNQLNQVALLDLYNGYASRDIPVGCVLVDSQWSTGVNNFIWNRKKFPNHQEFIRFFHSKGIKVITWATGMVNLDSSNYKEGYDNNYYLNNGTSVRWWRGTGSFLDYTNPKAVEWWHAQLDKEALGHGIDGWKVDGIDPVLLQLIIPRGQRGVLQFREYTDMYYRDFFYYSRQSRGKHTLIMARPWERYGIINYKFAPRDVVYAGWVGDQDGNFEGLKVALISFFHSAWDNYVNFGSDIGGYRSEPTPHGREKILFIRWAQLGAFNSLMENGGGKEHRPWMFDQETSDIYKRFTVIHHELIPYVHSAGAIAWERNTSVMFPIAKYTPFIPDSWDYMFWRDIYVQPMVDNRTEVTVKFPAGNDWIDWWNGQRHAGGSVIERYAVSIAQFPVFRRVGAIIPLDVFGDVNGNGDESSKGFLTVLIQHPKENHKEAIEIREFQAGGCSVSYEFENGDLRVLRSAHMKPVILIVRGVDYDESLTVENTGTVMESCVDMKSCASGVVKMKNEVRVKISDATRGFIVSMKHIHTQL